MLKVPSKASKNVDKEKVINIISNSTFENCQQLAISSFNPTFNPLDKLMELYKRMLKEKDEMFEALREK